MLLEAADAGALSSPAAVAMHVRRLLAAAGKPSKTKLLPRFFDEYLRYPEALYVFKEYPGFSSGQLEEAGDNFINHGLDQGKGFLQHLLTSDLGYVKWNTTTIPVSWGIDPKTVTPANAGIRSFRGERWGILTQPAWLVSFSKADETDPIRRGRFILESFLCGAVPELPLDVVPQLPDMPTATLRERLAVHTADPRCAGCHTLMDPLGLPLEQYDHLGARRTTEAMRPVNTTGQLIGSVDKDGPLSGPEQLARQLASSKRVSECFVRHAFRFTLGRNETAADACSIAAAAKAFQSSGEDPTELFVALMSSDSFLYRK
jgi:hypothetical protein